MALKDIYFKAEDGYYKFLDWIDARGVPVYSLVDAFEDRGIPTFPIALIVLIAIIAGLGFLAYGIVAPGTSSVMLSISSDGAAIANADVIITLPNGTVQTGNTTDEGKFLAKLPIGQEVGIKITKANYKDKAMRFTAKSESESLPLVLELLRKTLSRTIQLLQKGTTELVKEEVAIQFSCSAASDYSETKTTSNGVIELTGIPENCGILYAAPKNGFTTEQDAIELGTAGATVNVYLSEEIRGKGAINVYAVNEAQQAVAGIEVNLKDESSLQIAKKITGSSGSAVFSEIPAGKYYFTTYDASGKYADFDGRTEINELLPDKVLQKNIVLFTKAVGKIMLLLKDSSTNAPVSNAAVKLIKDGAELASRPSAIDGKVEFNVAENVSYEIAIDHPAYMLKTLTKVQKSAAYADVLLSPATSANANSLKVKVVDEFALPVEDAKVRLHKASDKSIVGSELSTGINGEVAFERLEPDNYYAEVLKTGFGSAVSDVTAVVAREENSAVVRLAIGTGTFEVSVLDSEQKPLAAAKVEVYNAYTNAKLSENTTDLQGKKAIDERIDRKIYFVASASGYLKHTTIAYLPIRDVTQKIEIALAKDIPKLEVKVIGIFATEDLEIADSLSPGQKYIAKLQLLIPANSSFDEAGLHIRTGGDDALIMEKDAIYLRNIYASTSGMTKGTSYTPSNNYATDALHLTTGNAKWADIAWKNASDGIYDAEAEIIVKDGIAIGTLTELQYRGWGKKGAYVRFPTDSTLGSSESTGSKQALYAQTNSLPLSIGPSNLCDDVFCYRLIVEDIASGNLQTSIVDSYSAKVSNDYKLIFTITSKSSTTFAGSKLKIYNETGSLGFSGYEITTVTGAKIPGTLTGASLEIDVGDVAANSKFYGTLGIRTIKEGSTQLKLELISGNEKVMQKSIAINIAGAKALSIEVLPKIIVPFVQNNLLIRVTDSNDASALADAVVTILKNGTTLASGTTDFNGIFAYALASVSSGTSLEFRAEKSNYKQNSISMSASEDILQVSPEKISETLTIAGADRKDVELVLNNITELPLKISSLSASGDLDGLATITFADTYEDSALPKGDDFNIGIVLDLTDEGKRVEEITKLSASIDISLESSEATSTWRMSVPVNITIGFGAEADDSSCLVINPDTWDLFASTGSKTLNIALQNNCEVSGEGIVLREFSAKITQANDNALGTFELSSDIEDSSDVSLTNTYAEIAPLIEAGASATLKLEFEPEDITSGEATYNIILKAINKTTRGDEEITAQLKVNAKVNDLQECVEVVQSTALVIESCPYNLGYGTYGGSGGGYGYGGTYGGYGGGAGYGYSGAGYGGLGGYGSSTYNPYQQWGYTPTQQPWLGTSDQLYANNYPNSNYQQPFYGSDYGTGGYGGISGGIGSYGASFNCGKTSFTVRNNCSSAVEISLSSDPALIVDKATTELSAGEELESEVQAAYMVGNYPIDVKARVADSKESSTTIETLMVKVDNIFTKTWFDCVQLDKKKFQFNNFIGKPVSGKVFNDCYDSGVRLIYSADAIKISEGASAPQKMVQEVAVTGIFTEGAGDHTREVLQFDIIKDVRYKGEKTNLSSSNPLQQIGNLRYALTAGYYTVESRATMSVEFITRYGTRERIPFNVTLEDLWLAAERLPQEDIFGNQDPNFKLDQCINMDALNFERLIGTEGGCLPSNDAAIFPGGVFTHPPAPAAPASTLGFGWYLPFYSPSNSDNWVMKVSNKLCGSADRIELRTTSLTEKQGVKVYFETAQNGHDIKVTVNAQGIRPNAKVKFDEKIQVVATRPSKGETKQYALPFKFCVAGEKVPVKLIQPVVGLKCGETGAITGSDVYGKYGFAHLKYEWDWDSIAKAECDKKEGTPDNYAVCDATQFSIALNKKANEIRKLAENIGNLGNGIGQFLADDPSMNGMGFADFANSAELFRFVKKQTTVRYTALASNDKFVFFVNSDDGILENADGENKPIEIKSAEKLKKTSYTGMYDNIKTVNDSLPAIEKELKELSGKGTITNENDLVIELEPKEFTFDEKIALRRLGADSGFIQTKPYLILEGLGLQNKGDIWTIGGDEIKISDISERMVEFKIGSDEESISRDDPKVTIGSYEFELIDFAPRSIFGDFVKFSVKISSNRIPEDVRGSVRDAASGDIVGKEALSMYVLTFAEYKTLYDRLWAVLNLSSSCAGFNKNIDCCDKVKTDAQEASKCYITRISVPSDPTVKNNDKYKDQTYITSDLLRKIHKNAEFKIGIRHAEKIPKAQKAIILKDGADDKSLLPENELNEKYVSLEQFYKENVSFQSYLMRDGYPDNFKSDFQSAYAADTATDDATVKRKGDYTLLSNFKDNWSFKNKEGKDALGSIENPGLYNVELYYDFISSLIETSIEDKIQARVDTEEKSVEALPAPMRDNLFFYMPVDGTVGETARSGYGTAFFRDAGTLSKFKENVIFSYKPPSLTTKSVAAAHSGAGIENFESSYTLLYTTLRNGSLLNIDRETKKFAFSPSIPVALWAKIIKNSTEGGGGIFYKIPAGQGEVPGMDVGPQDSLLSWEFVKSNMGNSDFGGKQLRAGDLLSEMYQREHILDKALCSDNERHGIVWPKVTTAGCLVLRTIAYTPAEYPYSLEALCGADNVIISKDKGESFEAGPGGAFVLNSQASGEHVKQNLNLPEIFKRLNDSSICMKSTAKSVQFIWNTDNIYAQNVEPVCGASTVAAVPADTTGH